MSKVDWSKLAEFQDANKDLLIMIASPREDSISISFGGLNGFVRFPPGEMDKGIVFNALRESKFNDAIDPFINGVMEATGIKETGPGGELLKVLGGGIRSIGKGRELQKNKITKKYGAKNKNR